MNQSQINELIHSSLVAKTTHDLFKKQDTQLITRPASLIIKLKNEPEDKIFRIILLPPKGFTSNISNETSPHPEVRKAKVTIKGGVKLNKSGFSILKNVLKYQYYTVRNIKIVGDRPYPKIGGQHYKEQIKSAKEKFFVVRENGIGFYHNLVNFSNEWLLLVLEKELRLQKSPDIQSKISALNQNNQKTFCELYRKVLLYGDAVFEKDKRLVNKVCNFDVAKVAPPLIELLNVFETGKHEPCTIYAIILKIGKKHKMLIKYLREAVTHKAAPKYYLEELIKKLS